MIVDVLQTLVDGLLIGMSYGLIALGFTLVFGVFKRINLAFGACLLLGAALAIWLQSMLNYGVFGLVFVTITGSALASIYVEKICFSPHIGPNAANASMIASFAIWMQLDEISTILLPQRTHAFAGIEFEGLEFAGLLFRIEHLTIALVAILCVLLVSWLNSKSRLSQHIKAVKEDPNLAEILGLPVSRINITVFALSGCIGGLGAFLILSADGHVTPLFGIWTLFKGLAAVMIGGLGSIPGAMIGGIVLGLSETYAAYSFGAEFRDIVTFSLLFAVMIIRPSGLFGSAALRTEQMAKARI